MTSPPLYQYLRLPERVKDFTIEQLVPKLSVEALVVTVLPGTAWLDKQRFDTELGEPGPDRLCRKLWPIV